MNTLSYEEKRKVGKPMMWIAIISMLMVFAGLTSAVVVRKGSTDWDPIELPHMFYVSSIIILLSSITMEFAKSFAKKQNREHTNKFLLTTLILGLIFFYTQFSGFGELIEKGVFFTGKNSTISGSFVYVITVLHLLHVVAGIISLTVVLYQNYKGKYLNDKTLGLEISSIFWHFLGVLWIYLFVFLIFIQ